MTVKTKTLEKYLAELRRTADKRTTSKERAIRRIYKELLKDLREFMGVEYAILAEDDKLTYEILQRKGQYARFLEEVTRRVDNLSPEVTKEIRNVVEEIYKLCYDGMLKAVKNCIMAEDLRELLSEVHYATPEVVKMAVENPISGLTLADILERHRREIVYTIKKQITVGLLNGDRMSSMAKRITEATDMSYRKAIGIARTETHRVAEGGFCDSAVRLNEKISQGTTGLRMVKKWKSMQDERVRHTRKANHVKMNGVTVAPDEYFNLGNGVKAKAPGQSGSASNDINCRCICIYDLEEPDTTNNK